MWNFYTRRTAWRVSDNGASAVYCEGADRDLRVRALKSANASLEIAEHPDHLLLTVAGGPGGSPLDAWPVGSVYIAVDAVSPATRFGGGTWAAFAAGRVLVGLNGADPDFDTVRKTGGAKTHTLQTTEIPAHTHVQNAHNHTQDAHSHTIPVGATDDTAAPFDRADAGSNTGGANATAATGTATATNQAATAVNQNAGGGLAHNNLQPYIVVHMWERTA